MRLGLLLVLTAALGACSAYVRNEPSASGSAAAGGTASAPLTVKFYPDKGGPEQYLPTDYPNFHPGDKAQVVNGKVVPM